MAGAFAVALLLELHHTGVCCGDYFDGVFGFQVGAEVVFVVVQDFFWVRDALDLVEIDEVLAFQDRCLDSTLALP